MIFKRRVYICQNKDEIIRMDSTSGGVFSALAQYVLDRNGVVFGAEFDKTYKVIHGMGKTTADLSKFRGSKYVQSNMGDIFKDVKELLQAGRWVLFTGTPCQVAGLKSFLGKEYKNLVLMDFVCFSISSPGVWKQYLSHLQNNGIICLDEVADIKFRDKSRFGYEYTFMTFYDKEGHKLLDSGPETNQMLRSFVSNTVTRPSCYKCACKTVERVSDFTALDCYNIYKYDKKMDDNKGTSHLMVHNEKALEILEGLKQYLFITEVDFQEAVKSEPAMTECSTPSEIRASFFSKFSNNKDPFNEYFKDSVRVKAERLIRKIFSSIGLYKYIKRILKG